MNSMRTSMVLTFILLACSALAGVGPDENSTAVTATPGALSLFCLPDGSGSVFADAYVKGGSGGYTISADATITLTARDYDDSPLAGIPAEDLWLEWVDSENLQVCTGGTIADTDTDAEGIATWNSALRLGGYSESLVQVLVNGVPLTTSAGLAISVNSPDINHDNDVDLADVGIFARDYAESWVRYRSDFVSDGVLNLADVSKLAYGMGDECE